MTKPNSVSFEGLLAKIDKLEQRGFRCDVDAFDVRQIARGLRQVVVKLQKNYVLQERRKKATRCQYSGCNEWRGVKQFYSYEEGYVNMCRKHRDLNEGKTGYTDERIRSK